MELTRFKRYLGMKFDPVPVKISREELDGESPPFGSLYCGLVREAASSGCSYRLTPRDAASLGCLNPEVILGFREPRYVEIEGRLGGGTRSVVIGTAAKDDFDVLILILSPRQVMDVSILLGGLCASFRGQMALCREATATPLKAGKANVSFLCRGCREMSGYREDEVVLGLTRREAEHLLDFLGKGGERDPA